MGLFHQLIGTEAKEKNFNGHATSNYIYFDLGNSQVIFKMLVKL